MLSVAIVYHSSNYLFVVCHRMHPVALPDYMYKLYSLLYCWYFTYSSFNVVQNEFSIFVLTISFWGTTSPPHLARLSYYFYFRSVFMRPGVSVWTIKENVASFSLSPILTISSYMSPHIFSWLPSEVFKSSTRRYRSSMEICYFRAGYNWGNPRWGWCRRVRRKQSGTRRTEA